MFGSRILSDVVVFCADVLGLFGTSAILRILLFFALLCIGICDCAPGMFEVSVLAFRVASFSCYAKSVASVR